MTAPTPLASLRALLDRATPAPWEATEVDRTGRLSIRRLNDSASAWIAHTIKGNAAVPDLTTANVNSHLIVSAINALPDLLALAEKAEAYRDALALLVKCDEDYDKDRDWSKIEEAREAAMISARAALALPAPSRENPKQEDVR